MKTLLPALVATLLLAMPATAGDAAKGEREFGKCKTCHAIVAPDGTEIVKGPRTGPNLWGVIGRTAGTYEGFRYGPSIVAAGAKGLVWDEPSLAAYVADPPKFLREYLGDGKARSNMTFKLPRGGEDVAAYLAAVASATN